MLLVNMQRRCVLLFFCLVFIVSCKGEHKEEKDDNRIEEVKPPEYIIVNQNENESTYFVEGVDQNGQLFKGQIRLKGEVGAGQIAKDSASAKLYIEVRRSQDGGLIGTDINGVVYQLAFLNEE